MTVRRRLEGPGGERPLPTRPAWLDTRIDRSSPFTWLLFAGVTALVLSLALLVIAHLAALPLSPRRIARFALGGILLALASAGALGLREDRRTGVARYKHLTVRRDTHPLGFELLLAVTTLAVLALFAAALAVPAGWVGG